jgi:hypothetical protein
MMFTHMICGMGVEVAGTEHVATAGFDIRSGHIKVRFGRVLLRGRGEINKAGSKRKERKYKQARHTSHGPSEKTVENRAQPGLG